MSLAPAKLPRWDLNVVYPDIRSKEFDQGF
ncbi:MAG: hypothetical protein JWO59_81, partial [Chloroflexi bacterium]|nr:hypothetical protein [Chloroflexota bacterium]